MQFYKNLITIQVTIDKQRTKPLKKTYLVIGALILLILLTLWLINMDLLSFGKLQSTEENLLEKDGMECVGIAEKSVAHMVAVVEFQQLEIIGRKARVMRNCMQDHGYQQNPVWTTYATPIAEKTAKETKVSFDEAFENLRRQHMVIFKSTENQPLFWQFNTKK